MSIARNIATWFTATSGNVLKVDASGRIDDSAIPSTDIFHNDKDNHVGTVIYNKTYSQSGDSPVIAWNSRGHIFWSAGNIGTKTPTFADPDTDDILIGGADLILVVGYTGTGGAPVITWPSGVFWPVADGTPTFGTVPSTSLRDVFRFIWDGTRFFGKYVGRFDY